jgi:hypothetical protein
LLIFELSQSESNEFNCDQSESTTQTWVAQLGVDKRFSEFLKIVLQHNTVCTQANILSGQIKYAVFIDTKGVVFA